MDTIGFNKQLGRKVDSPGVDEDNDPMQGFVIKYGGECLDN